MMYKKITLSLAFIFGSFFSKSTIAVAQAPEDVTDRVNKIRTALHQNIKAGNTIEINGNDVLNKNLSEWVNWGNWGNWNNWNNWRNWNNWVNWNNF